MLKPVLRHTLRNTLRPVIGDDETEPSASFAVSDFSETRGALDLAGHADITFEADPGSDPILSYGTLSGTAGSEYTASLDAGVLTLTLDTDTRSSGTVVVPCYPEVAQGGTPVNVTVTLTAEANTHYVETSAEASAVGPRTGRAYGETIKLLTNTTDTDGLYTGYWKPTAAATGTWSTSNYITVTKAAGHDPVIGEFTVDNGNDIEPGYRFTELKFHRPWDGLSGDPGFDIVNSNNKDLNMKIDNCEFWSEIGFSNNDGTFDSATADCYSMIRLRNEGNNIIIEDNTFHDCSIPVRALGDYVTVRGNKVDSIISDGIVVGGSNVLVEYNIITNLYPFDPSSYHPDGIQFNGGGNAQSNVTIQYNEIYTQGDVSYAQQIFCSNSGGNDFTNFLIRGNTCVGAAANAILLVSGVNSEIRGNTVVEDPASTSGFTPKIYVSGTGTKVLFNVCDIIEDAGTDSVIAYNTQLDYDTITFADHFVNPVNVNAIDNPGGSVSYFDIKTGSTADSQSPKHGAHQDYFDRSNRTTDFSDYTTWENSSFSLSSPTDAEVGDSGYEGTVTAGKVTGLLYHIASTSTTKPSVAQIQAGQDHTGVAAPSSGSQINKSLSAQNIEGTGLSGGTGYYLHYQAKDDYGNDTAVVTADGFTTAASFTPQYNDFDGATYGSRGASLDGAVDGTKFLFYAHLNFDVINTNEYIWHGGTSNLYIRRYSNNKIQVRVYTATQTINLVSVDTFPASTNLGIMVSIDTAGECQLYVIEGSDPSVTGSMQATSTQTLGENINFTTGDSNIFHEGTGSNVFAGVCGSYYLALGQSLDLSVSSNRNKFCNQTANTPLSLSAAPAAALKFTQGPTEWNAVSGNNEGSGGDVNITGIVLAA